MDSEYIDTTLEGNLRIGSARYYRLLEIATNDDCIGDRTECQTIADAGPITITPENRNPQALRMLENNHLALVESGATLILEQGARIIHATDCYIQSMSIGEIGALKAAMTDPEKDTFSYNGCIEFTNIDALCEHIFKHGKINDIPCSDFFRTISHNKIAYTGQVTDPWNEQILANPFLKDPKYIDQSEYRIVFFPNSTGMIEDHLIINFPDADKFLKEVFRNEGSESVSMCADTRTQGELVAVLENAKNIISQHRQASSAELLRVRNNGDDLEEYLQRDSIRNAQFEEMFLKNHLDDVIKAYWSLRCKGFTSLGMDRAFDPYTGTQMLNLELPQYLNSIT